MANFLALRNYGRCVSRLERLYDHGRDARSGFQIGGAALTTELFASSAFTSGAYSQT